MCTKAQDQVPVCTDHPELQTEWNSQCRFDGIIKDQMEVYESHFKKKNKRRELTECFTIYSVYTGKSIANDKKTVSNFLEPLFRLNAMAEVGRLA